MANPSQRKASRAVVKDRIKGVFVRCKDLSRKDLKVFNISELGVGIDTEGMDQIPEPGKPLEAEILVGYTKAPVTISLVHVTPTFAGMKFVNPTDLLRGAIKAFFDPELAGASIREINVKHQPTPDERDVPPDLKFSDGKKCTLEIWIDNEEVNSFLIEMLGNEIFWEQGQSLKWHQNNSTHPIDDLFRNQLTKLVSNIEDLNPEHKGQIISAIQN